MKLIFAGTPEFAAVALRALITAGHDVHLVLTQPDRPSGRGMKLLPSPVKQVALERGIPVEQPVSLKDAAVQEGLRELIRIGQVEAMIVAAYGLILPQSVLDMPARGCLNIHASLLPRWRGAAPIQRALQAGDTESGVGIMQMEAGLDTGPVLYEKRLAIAINETGASLHDRLAVLGGEAIVEALARLDQLTPQVQPAEGITYAHKLNKAESLVDFTRPADELARRIRAFDPVPGSTATLGEAVCKFWAAEAVEGVGDPGTVLRADAGGVVVACSSGALRITELQKPGGKRLVAREFLAGFPLMPGQRFS